MKLFWIIGPLGLYATYVAVAALRRKLPSRHVLSVQVSLLLMLYLLLTAGLGIFWVAHQQLPAFDLHYLLGYTMLLLLAVHLSFNVPAVLRYLRRLLTGRPAAARRPKQRGRPADRPAPARTALFWLLAAAALVAAFALGARHSRPELRWSAPAGSASALYDRGALGQVEVIRQYHEHSSLSRTGVFAQAPSIDWGEAPPPFKRYPHAERVLLPPPTEEPGAGRSLSAAIVGPAAPPARPEELSLAALGAILFHSSGVTAERGGYKLRAAPSSGGLFPTEIYLLAQRVARLERGLYHYDPEHHALHRLPQPAEPLDGAQLGAPGLQRDIEAAPLTVVLTAVLGRTGHKYSHRAYRYAVADVGHLLENLRLAAGEMGLETRLLDRFDEQQAAATLAVDGEREAVMALAVLPFAGAPAAPARPGPEPGGGFVYRAQPGSAFGVISVVHAATSLQLGGSGGGPASPPPYPAQSTQALPAAPDTTDTVLQTIRQRRSVRRFSGEPIELETLAGLLRDAAAGPVQLSGAIRLGVISQQVKGLAAGVYRYRPEPGELDLVRAGDVAAEAASAALSQDVVRDAAATLVLLADQQQILHAGARAYRHAYLETGLIGERISLGIVARGLGGCPVGAFYDDEAAALLGVDPGREWVVHFVPLGLMP